MRQAYCSYSGALAPCTLKAQPAERFRYLFHVVPVGDDSVLYRVLQGQDPSFALCFVAHVAVFLSHSHHHSLKRFNTPQVSAFRKRATWRFLWQQTGYKVTHSNGVPFHLKPNSVRLSVLISSPEEVMVSPRAAYSDFCCCRYCSENNGHSGCISTVYMKKRKTFKTIL